MPKRERPVPAYKQRRQDRTAKRKQKDRIGLAKQFGPPLMEALGLTGMPRVLSLGFVCDAGQLAEVTIRQAMSERQRDAVCELLRERQFTLVPRKRPMPAATPFEPEPFGTSSEAGSGHPEAG